MKPRKSLIPQIFGATTALSLAVVLAAGMISYTGILQPLFKTSARLPEVPVTLSPELELHSAFTTGSERLHDFGTENYPTASASNRDLISQINSDVAMLQSDATMPSSPTAKTLSSARPSRSASGEIPTGDHNPHSEDSDGVGKDSPIESEAASEQPGTSSEEEHRTTSENPTSSLQSGQHSKALNAPPQAPDYIDFVDLILEH